MKTQFIILSFFILQQVKLQAASFSDLFSKLNLVHKINKANGDYPSAQSLLEGLEVENNIQQNLKTYYTLYHTYRTQPSLPDGFDTELSTLIPLPLGEIREGLCPYTDGPAVYKARSLYSIIYGQLEHYMDDECQGLGYVGRAALSSDKAENDEINLLLASHESKQIKSKKNTKIVLYPNPTNGTFYIKGNNITETYDVFITTASGTLIENKKIEPNNSLIQIQLNAIPGIYFINLVNSKGLRTVKKLIIKN